MKLRFNRERTKELLIDLHCMLHVQQALSKHLYPARTSDGLTTFHTEYAGSTDKISQQGILRNTESKKGE